MSKSRSKSQRRSKKKDRKYLWILLGIFALVLAIRLIFAFSTPYFSSDDSYFNLRQIQHIRDTGAPLFDDPLSYSGRTLIFSPLFHYILAFFGLFMPLTVVGKIFPNIFASLLVFFVYLIIKKITNNQHVSLITAFIVGFVPIFFKETVNSVSPYSLVIPLFFLLFYALMNLKDKNYVYIYIFILLILLLMHPSVVIFVLALLIYLLLIKVEKIKQNRAELEIILFSVFFVFWLQFVLFKKIFLFHGPFVIWQNIPSEILSNYFSQITILEGIYQIGLIPFFCGIYIIYHSIFKEKRTYIYMMISFAFAVGLLLWLRLIELNVGLMFLGVILTVLFGRFYNGFVAYIKNTRVAGFNWLFTLLIFIIIIFTSVIPSLTYAEDTVKNVIQPSELRALFWLKEKTADNSVVLSTVDEGNLITSIANRRNVIDPNFLLVEDAKDRYEDVKQIFQTQYTTEAVELSNKYDVDYVYFSPKSRQAYDIEELRFLDYTCFNLVYSDIIQIYESLCEIEVQE